MDTRKVKTKKKDSILVKYEELKAFIDQAEERDEPEDHKELKTSSVNGEDQIAEFIHWALENQTKIIQHTLAGAILAKLDSITNPVEKKLLIPLHQALTASVEAILKNLDRYIKIPDPSYGKTDFDWIEEWFQANKGFISASQMKQIEEQIEQAKKIYAVYSSDIKSKLKAVRDFLRNGTSVDLKSIYNWYSKNSDFREFVDGFCPLLTIKLAIAFIKIANNKENKDLSEYAFRAAFDIISNLPRKIIYDPSLKPLIRKQLHEAYLLLAQKFEKSEDESIRKTTGHFYINAIRTLSYVEPFDHFTLINTYKDDLPYTGVCNAITSEGIRFYTRPKNQENSLVVKLNKKMNANEKPATFLQRLSLFQQHNISATDDNRLEGLPFFKVINKQCKKKSNASIEILTDLGFSTKHSILARRTGPNTLSILDATFGEAHPSNETEFDECMDLLSKGYRLIYGSVRFVLVDKQKLLIEDKTPLFKSNANEAADMTFKDKIRIRRSL